MTTFVGHCPMPNTVVSRRQRGFTLIELMMAVAIVGIFASIAIPAYSVYTVRARVSEGIVLTDDCRNAVSELYQMQGATRSGFQADGWGCDEGRLAPSQYVKVVHTDDVGAIYVTLNPTDARLGGAQGQDIVLTPIVVGGNLNPGIPGGGGGGMIRGWTCRPGPSMPREYLPSTCR